jgi:hypothetical protein
MCLAGRCPVASTVCKVSALSVSPLEVVQKGFSDPVRRRVRFGKLRILDDCRWND